MRLEPFDATDPADLMADKFRKEVARIAQRVFKDKRYRSLSSIKRVECFMAGIATGLIGVCFAHIESAGRDAMMEAITEYLPQAREQAEAIFEDAARAKSH